MESAMQLRKVALKKYIGKFSQDNLRERYNIKTAQILFGIYDDLIYTPTERKHTIKERAEALRNVLGDESVNSYEVKGMSSDEARILNRLWDTLQEKIDAN